MSYYENEMRQDNGTKTAIGIALGIVVVVLFILASIGSSFIGTYNGLVEAEEKVSQAQADVQTMMQRRLELIPDLVKTAQAAADHEEAIYEDIANARAALNESTENLNEMLENGGDIQSIDEANSQLTTAINELLVIVESYPTITASQQYTSLMDQLEGSVNRISVAREEYNAVVTEYNQMVRKFPGNIIASMFGFERIEPFKADEAANDSSLVDFN